MPTIVPFETLTELFKNLAQKYKGQDKTAFAFKPGADQEYKTVTWDQVDHDVRTMASYMVEHGVNQGDRVAILSENRYEWAVIDLAIQYVGAVNVGLYTSLPPGQCEYILRDSEARLFFVSTSIQLKKAYKIFSRLENLQQVIAFDRPKQDKYLEEPWSILYEKAYDEGESLLDKHRETLRKRSNNAMSEDLATLIYTSGTTGQPKGAMLTHRNIISNVKAAHQMIHIDQNDRCLSFLPLCHSFERTGGYYAMIAAGAEIYYAESVDTVAKNLPEVQPTLMISVPRLFERIYTLVKKNIEEGPDFKKRIFDWALEVGARYADGERGLVSMQKQLADLLVFNKLKQKTGGRIRFFVSGGAALPSEIGNFFMAAGLNILEGYGLTETSPVIAANQLNQERIGTVGKIIPGVTVGIQRLEDNEIVAQVSGEDYPTDIYCEEGEIIVKGPNVMKGYWKREEETNDIIDEDNWLHTGDIGQFVDGRLKITDRIKHMIVNAGGKNVYPGPIEDMYKTSKWIDQMMIVGEKQPYMGALIVPDFEVLEGYADENGLSYDSMEDLVENEEVRELYKKEIKRYSHELASHEKIRAIRVVPEEFTVEGGELTPTLKIKRRVVEDKYHHLIHEMFED